MSYAQFAAVTVSVRTMLSVAEGDGTVSVCVTLVSGAVESTQRDFTVELTTTDNTGN